MEKVKHFLKAKYLVPCTQTLVGCETRPCSLAKAGDLYNQKILIKKTGK